MRWWPWSGAALAVSDATINARVSAARKAVGDDGTRQAVIRTVHRRGFAMAAEVSSRVAEVAGMGTAPPQRSAVPETRFPRSADGTAIAWTAEGEGPDLVRIGHWLTHLELDHESPVFGPDHCAACCPPPADPLRRARHRPVAAGGGLRRDRPLRGRPRGGDGGRLRRCSRRFRRVAGGACRHRLCRAAARAGATPRGLWRLRDGTGAASGRGRRPWRGDGAGADPRGLGGAKAASFSRPSRGFSRRTPTPRWWPTSPGCSG